MGRYKQREKSTKKRNVVLFSALGAVLLALLFLPKDALLMGNEEEEPVKKETKEPKHKVVKLQPDNEHAYKDDEKSSDNNKSSQAATEEQEPSEEIGIDPEKEADKKEKAKKAEEEKKKQQAAADKPKINEPIGTTQTGTHTSSYEEGSVDWNEKLKAIRLATGLDENMTVWKIANGGGPQKSIAEVSPDGKPGERYTVNLEWVDQKGWKVTSVEK
jgi:predicted  nucleic acid-binding Zn-ribbon protein